MEPTVIYLLLGIIHTAYFVHEKRLFKPQQLPDFAPYIERLGPSFIPTYTFSLLIVLLALLSIWPLFVIFYIYIKRKP